MTVPEKSKYTEAGVDIDKGNAFVKGIKDIVSSTHQRGVVSEIGGFSSLFAIDKESYNNPVLVSSTDGVGTKLAVAQMCKKHDTIGIDLVAMCVNDIIVSGAKPLFFLDYFSSGELDLQVATDVVKGIADGCIQAGCSLVGGETAEMPGLYNKGEYDLAGFVTGIIDRDKIIDGSGIGVGNKIIGLSSNGLHSNGFSLARNICFNELRLSVDDYIEQLAGPLGDELLKPTRIYVKPILNILKRYEISGMVHNTGGGFIDNIPRILPNGCKAIINTDSWEIPPVFKFLSDKGDVSLEEMFRTFNMGIGFMCVVNEEDIDDIMHHFQALGETPYIIGAISARQDDEAEVLIK